jgi:hypothetical protein
MKALPAESESLPILHEYVERLLILLAAVIHEARAVAEVTGRSREFQLIVRNARKTHDTLRGSLAVMQPNAPEGAHDRLDAMGKAVDLLEHQRKRSQLMH